MKTAGKRLSQPRTLRLGKCVNGVLSIAMADGRGERDAYWITKRPSAWGRAFRIDRVSIEPGEDNGYDVLLDDRQGHSCTCKGFSFKSKCKHVAALLTLTTLGIL